MAKREGGEETCPTRARLLFVLAEDARRKQAGWGKRSLDLCGAEAAVGEEADRRDELLPADEREGAREQGGGKGRLGRVLVCLCVCMW
jgi:hypothetical protein